MERQQEQEWIPLTNEEEERIKEIRRIVQKDINNLKRKQAIVIGIGAALILVLIVLFGIALARGARSATKAQKEEEVKKIVDQYHQDKEEREDRIRRYNEWSSVSIGDARVRLMPMEEEVKEVRYGDDFNVTCTYEIVRGENNEKVHEGHMIYQSIALYKKEHWRSRVEEKDEIRPTLFGRKITVNEEEVVIGNYFRKIYQFRRATAEDEGFYECWTKGQRGRAQIAGQGVVVVDLGTQATPNTKK